MVRIRGIEIEVFKSPATIWEILKIPPMIALFILTFSPAAAKSLPMNSVFRWRAAPHITHKQETASGGILWIPRKRSRNVMLVI